MQNQFYHTFLRYCSETMVNSTRDISFTMHLQYEMNYCVSY